MEKFLPWIEFNLFVLVMLAIDLGVMHRKSHEVQYKEALIWSGVCVTLALAFGVGVFVLRGSADAMAFLTGYVIELSLSVDNLFVFLLIFSYFRVPAVYQHGVLFWGILGALVMRAIFIFAGVALINKFHWIIYLFGGMLIFSGIKLAFEKDKEIHPEHNPVLRLFERVFPVSKSYEGNRFFVRKSGKLFATPLFIVLLALETTDIIFAVDSVPAVLAISRDPFIVYTSNVFAILGLRSLYFVLARVMQLFHYLHYGLAVILTYVGLKMILSDVIHIPTQYSLLVIVVVLGLSVWASMAWPIIKGEKPGSASKPAHPHRNLS